ncbi:autotransporter domain-containing protein, partial [Burkholderia gladioli]|uniref:autotransporter domain-containing protein n=1 Tax=Burkholderia gladioli TaxID=28095 RepID=UPI001640E459
TATLTGVNTFTGGATVNAGTLALGAGGSLAAGTGVNLANAGTGLDISNSSAGQTIGGLTGVTGSTVTLGNNSLSFGDSGNETFGGSIGGAGGIVKIGSGTATLTGANSFTGGATVDAGTLAIGAGGSLSAGTGVNLANAGATFDIGNAGGAQTIGGLTGVAGTTVNLGGNGLSFGDSGNETFGGTIAGTGGITKEGTGTATLTGANSFTGGATVNAGTLAIGAGGSLAAGGTVNLANTGTRFDLSGANTPQTVGGLAGAAGSTVNLGGNTLTLGGAGNTSFGGTITGTGGLVKAGTGSQTLGADSTYSGGTTLGGGTLVVGSNGALGSGALTVSGPATLDTSAAVTLNNAVNLGNTATIGGSQDLTLAGTVSGTGGLVKDGNAALTLSGSNTYSGGTTLNGGSLALGNAQALGTGALTVNGGSLLLGSTTLTLGSLDGAAGGTIDTGSGGLNVAGGGTYGGALTGAGSLTKSGTGTLTLTGDNSYAGGTTIAGGTLQVGNGGTSGTLAGNVANAGSLVFNRSDDTSFGGTVSGTGSLTQAGSGQLTLTGASTLSGPTTVAAGTLNVAGSLAQSTVTVMNGGTVTGTGTIGGLVVGNGATAAASQPGSSLNVGGNLTFQPGSTLQVAANPQQAGSVKATGAAQIGGGTVQVLANTGVYSPSTSYTIVDASGGLSGTFSNVTSNLAFLKPQLSYDANRAVLALVANGTSFTDVAQTPNQHEVAAAIGTLGAGNPVYDTLLSTDAPTARAAYNSLDGELYASMKSLLLTDSRYVRDAVTDRVRQGLAASSGPLSALAAGGASLCGDANSVLSGPAGAATAQQRCQSTPYQPVVWGQAFGGRSRFDGNNNASSVSRSMTGFIAGADVGLGDHWRAGVAGGVTHSSFDNDTQSSASADSYSLSIYGGGQFGALGLRGGAAYTWHRIDTDRYPGFAGFSDHAQSGINAQTAQVFGEVGYALPAGAVALEPFVNLAYVNLHTDGITETGGAAALRSANESNSIGFSTAGLRAATKFDVMSRGGFSARAMAGWRHAFGSTTPNSTFAFVSGGSAFQVSGVPIARDAAVVELGVDANLTQRLKLGLTYSGQYGSGVRDNAVLGNLLWKF